MSRFFLMVLFFIAIIPAAASAQDKDEIIAKYIEARGGAEKIKSVKSIVMTGVLLGGDVSYPIKFTCVAGKAFKVEMQANDTIAFQLVTQTNGWTFFPDTKESKPESMKEQDVEEAQDYLDLDGPLVDYQSKGYTIQYEGKEQVDNRQCYKLIVSKPGSMFATWYLDEQYYIYRIIKQPKDTTLQAEGTTYSNYKKTPEGIVFPYHWTVPGGYVDINKIELNTPVREEVFRFRQK